MKAGAPDLSHLYPLSRLQARFGLTEYLVLAVTLACSGLIGAWAAWRGRAVASTAEFLLAGRSVGVLPATLSIACSFISAITLLGIPAEIYQHGTQVFRHFY